MAEVKDGLPSTDFSRMNREYIKAVAEASGGGGGSGGGVLKLVDTDGVLDHTWNEIKSALSNGTYVSLIYSDDAARAQTQVTNARIEGEVNPEYLIGFTDGSLLYFTTNPDGYPVAD